MKLYYLGVSPNSFNVLVAVEELGIQLEKIPVDVLKGENRTPEFLKMNPNGKLPLLVDGDLNLWESNAINQYLADQVPGNTLFPKDARIRADITRWQLWQQAHWMHACGALIWERIVKKLGNLGEADPLELKRGEEGVQRYGAVLNQCLEGRQYLVQGDLSLADIAVAAPLIYMEQAQIPVDEFRHVKAWYGRIAERPSWKNNLPKF